MKADDSDSDVPAMRKADRAESSDAVLLAASAQRNV
jgi:hypothetical protein